MEYIRELLNKPFELSKSLSKLYKVYLEKFEFTGCSCLLVKYITNSVN